MAGVRRRGDALPTLVFSITATIGIVSIGFDVTSQVTMTVAMVRWRNFSEVSETNKF
jgi:hypothetical protein